MSTTKSLAVLLQKSDKDLYKAIDEVKITIGALEEKRKCVDKIIDTISTEAERMLGEKLTIPRTNKRQVHRDNVNASTPKEYYCRSILVPFLDELIGDLNTRFSNHTLIAMKMSVLIPKFLGSSTFEDLSDIIELYQPCCPFSKSDVKAEYERWRLKWLNNENAPSCPAAALSQCNPDFYPCLNNYLHIFCCLPVTTASAERTFSSLKYLKSYLRTTMTDERLTGLARMYIHRNIPVNPSSVIDKFSSKSRKIVLK